MNAWAVYIQQSGGFSKHVIELRGLDIGLNNFCRVIFTMYKFIQVIKNFTSVFIYCT